MSEAGHTGISSPLNYPLKLSNQLPTWSLTLTDYPPSRLLVSLLSGLPPLRDHRVSARREGSTQLCLTSIPLSKTIDGPQMLIKTKRKEKKKKKIKETKARRFRFSLAIVTN